MKLASLSSFFFSSSYYFLLYFTSLFLNGFWDEMVYETESSWVFGHYHCLFFPFLLFTWPFSPSSCFFFKNRWHGTIDLHRGGSMLLSFAAPFCFLMPFWPKSGWVPVHMSLQTCCRIRFFCLCMISGLNMEIAWFSFFFFCLN